MMMSYSLSSSKSTAPTSALTTEEKYYLSRSVLIPSEDIRLKELENNYYAVSQMLVISTAVKMFEKYFPDSCRTVMLHYSTLSVGTERQTVFNKHSCRGI